MTDEAAAQIRSGGGGGEIDQTAFAGAIIKKVLKVMLPVISNFVTTAVNSTTLRVLEQLAANNAGLRGEVERSMQKSKVCSPPPKMFELNIMEPYSRMENIRVSGIPEREDVNK